ncbi:MAG TPA: OmpA family protein [Puia sp.]|jgi:chemotaxis protein MotB|nr:OmpA family protein [Puia sp.]
MRPAYIYLIFLSSVAVSCVPTGKYKALQQQAQKTDSLYAWTQRTLKTCQDVNSDLNKQKTAAQNQLKSQELELNASKENITTLRKQLVDLSALSSAQAESLKKSIDNIGAKDSYIQDLRAAVSHRDSVNLVALMNLKAYMGGYGDQDVRIKVEKGTVSVDIADSLLFTDSNSYALTARARSVIGRLARVFNDVPEAGFTVEGHADSLASTQDSLPDSWDISVKRATAIVRMLQNDYHIAPSRMTAAGRTQELMPAATTDSTSAGGVTADRRTRVIIIPDTDGILQMLERK